MAAAHQIDDVADSTDWLSTPLSGLAAVEAALRCQVCKDFYKTPMLTSCNHTFCSVCIRRALSGDGGGKCPLCRAPEQELKLRSNWAMSEAVDAFVAARRDVLEFARRPPPPPPSAVTATPESPKRKRGDEFEASEESNSSGQRSNKRLRSSARLSKSNNNNNNNNNNRSTGTMAEMARQEAEVIQDSEDEDDTGDYEPDDGLVACPICQRRMKENLVFTHIDTCPGETPAKPPPPPPPQQQQTSRSGAFASSKSNPPPAAAPPPRPLAPPKNLERLPAIHYAMFKEAQLRKKLQELGISTAGNKAMLERRHKEWMTLWNANCDALHPRRKADLLHDLDAWERTLGSQAPTSSRSIRIGSQIKDKDFDGAAWAARHDSSFKDLIASARKNRSRVQPPPPQEPAEKNSENDDGQAEGEAKTGSNPGVSRDEIEEGEEPGTWTDAPRSYTANGTNDAAVADRNGARPVTEPKRTTVAPPPLAPGGGIPLDPPSEHHHVA